MMGKRFLVLLIGAVAMLCAVTMACGGDDNSDIVRAPTAVATMTAVPMQPAGPTPTPGASAPAPAAPTAVPPAPTSAPSAPAVAPAPVSLNVTISNFSFAPNPITVRAGQQLTLSVTNQDAAPHTLAIMGAASTGNIAGNGRGMVTFMRGTTGQVQFFCEVHGAARMSGTITVLP